jgi:hypothetical protein
MWVEQEMVQTEFLVLFPHISMKSSSDWRVFSMKAISVEEH